MASGEAACRSYGYEVTKLLGSGAFGAVYQAQKNGETLAVKHITKRFDTWNECMQQRELSSLHKMQKSGGPHPNIVALREVMHSKIDGSVFIVMEFCSGGNLYDAMKDDPAAYFDDPKRIAGVLRSVLSGCSHMHRRGFFHRDIKPENLLVCDDEARTVKIADFGCAREIRSAPPYTDYVSTRWYRAPENALRSREYSSPVDVWACGCVLAELLGRGQPLFPATSELDLVHRHFALRGDPWALGWGEGVKLAAQLRLTQPRSTSTARPLNFGERADAGASQLCEELLRMVPADRPSAQQALDHKFILAFAPAPAPARQQPQAPPELPVPAQKKGALQPLAPSPRIVPLLGDAHFDPRGRRARESGNPKGQSGHRLASGRSGHRAAASGATTEPRAAAQRSGGTEAQP